MLFGSAVLVAASLWLQTSKMHDQFAHVRLLDQKLAKSRGIRNAAASQTSLLSNSELVADPENLRLSLESVTKDIFMTATGNGLTVVGTTYRPHISGSTAEFSKTDITAELKGHYPALKKALFAIWQENWFCRNKEDFQNGTTIGCGFFCFLPKMS